jgi:hypothetical protein
MWNCGEQRSAGVPPAQTRSGATRVRILLVSPFLPHPAAAHGGGVYLAALAAGLADRAELGLVSFATPRERASGAAPPPSVQRSWLVERPELQDLGRLPRFVHRMRMLSRWTLGGLPVVVAKFRSAAMERTLGTAVAEFRPDVALVEMDLMAQYLPVLRGLPTVLTDHEAGDPVPAAVGPAGLGLGRDRRLWDTYLEHSHRGATALQALNEVDAARLAGRLGRPVGVRPPLCPLPDAAVRVEDSPPRLLFLGDYRHGPNPEAARYVAREILPRVRRDLGAAELWLAGPHATPEVQALAALPGVRVLGFVPDLAGLIGSARLLIAPVFSGGGSRIKVLTALAHGLPVVANELALRGVDAPPGAARRAGDAEGLAAATLDWLRDPAAAAEAGRAARRWAESAISPAAVAARQLDAIEALLRGRAAAR